MCVYKRHSLGDQVRSEKRRESKTGRSRFDRDQGPEERWVFGVVDGKTNNSAPVRERQRERETLASTGWSDRINTRHIGGRSHPVLSNGRDEEGRDGPRDTATEPKCARGAGHGGLLCRWNTNTPRPQEGNAGSEQLVPVTVSRPGPVSLPARMKIPATGVAREGGRGEEGAAKHPSCSHGNTGRGVPFSPDGGSRAVDGKKMDGMCREHFMPCHGRRRR